MSKDGLVETINYKGCTIEVYQDDNAESPREWDNIGTMTCFHRRYTLGDKHDLKSEHFDGWNGLRAHLVREEKAWVILPLGLYDHSGITMYIGNTHDQWDGGQVGFIWVTKEKMQKEFPSIKDTRKLRKRAEDALRAEVKTYDDFIRGNVYGFNTLAPDGEHLDSCWGFVGDYDEEGGCVAQAQDAIDFYLADKKKKHEARLKAQIKAGTPLDKRVPLEV